MTPLTDVERQELLRVARHRIGAGLGLVTPATLDVSTPALLAPGGAFVSVYAGGELRGCVGHVTASEPLHVTVADSAYAAAFSDTRFPPFQVADWHSLEVEISRLAEPRPSAASAIEVGHHGVLIRHGSAHALLLPQVAPRYGWEPAQLLAETCLKAGLRADAWRDPRTEILAFEAEIFRG